MHALTFSAVVVLPTPPFWFAIAYTVAIGCKLAAHAVRAADPRGNFRIVRPLSGAEWSLACDPRPARESLGRCARLHPDVQVTVGGRCERTHAADLRQLKTQQARRR